MKTFTTILLKPDALERNICGELISAFEDSNFKIEEIKSTIATIDRLSSHYGAHVSKEFYSDLIRAMVDKPLIAISASYEGDVPAFELGRHIVNAVRKHYGNIVQGPRNLVHCSDAEHEVGREYFIWFCT